MQRRVQVSPHCLAARTDCGLWYPWHRHSQAKCSLDHGLVLPPPVARPFGGPSFWNSRQAQLCRKEGLSWRCSEESRGLNWVLELGAGGAHVTRRACFKLLLDERKKVRFDNKPVRLGMCVGKALAGNVRGQIPRTLKKLNGIECRLSAYLDPELWEPKMTCVFGGREWDAPFPSIREWAC